MTHLDGWSAPSGPDNDTTRSEYDLLNRTRATISAARDTTRSEYASGSLYWVRDAKGQFYHYHRDRLGRVASEVDPRGQYTYHGFDRAGNATRMVNRRNQVTTATYDPLNRQLTRTTADGPQTTHEYGPNDAWVQSSNAESTVRTAFDVAGRPTQVQTTLGGVTYTQTNLFNAIGQRTKLRLTSTLAGFGIDSIGYSYDAAGKLDTITDFSGGKTLIARNDDGLEEARGLPNGEAIHRGYSSTHGTSAITYNNLQLSRDYAFDANGRIRAQHRMYNNGGTDRGRFIRNYIYDRRGFLTFLEDVRVADDQSTCVANGLDYTPDGGVCSPTGVTEYLRDDYFTYDRVGNRTDRGAAIEPGNRLMALNGFIAEYDADGNLTRKVKPGVDDVTLAWNSLGQLASGWRYQRGSFAYGYDPLGRRVRRVRRTGTNGIVTYHLYDGDDLLLEATASGTRIRQYTLSPGVDQPLSLHTGGATYYYGSESPGHVSGLVNAANQVVSLYRYNPWGEPEASTETVVTQPLRHMSREWDENLGMYQVRARWYDPQLGRFVSEDPMGLAGGINTYAYVGNNPVNATDPSGLCCGYMIIEVLNLSGLNCPQITNALESSVSIDGLSDYFDQLRAAGGGIAGALRGAGSTARSIGENINTFLKSDCASETAEAVVSLSDFYCARPISRGGRAGLRLRREPRPWRSRGSSRYVRGTRRHDRRIHLGCGCWRHGRAGFRRLGVRPAKSVNANAGERP